MSFFSRKIAEIREHLPFPEPLLPLSLKDPRLLRIFGAAPTHAGVHVNEQKALGIAAVYSAVRIIAWTIASLPLLLYRELNPGRERLSDDPKYSMLHDRWNPEQSSFEARSLVLSHMLLWGVGICEIEFSAKGQPVALWPIPPWCVQPMRTEKNLLIYQVSINGDTRRLWPDQLLVFKMLTTSPTYWISPIGLHRETMGMSLALSEFGAKVFSQGTNPSGILTLKGHMGDEDADKNFRKELKENYEGLSNSFRLMLLEEGTKFERVGMPPEDAQYLQSRAFNIREISRIFNVPLHLLQETDKSTTWGTGLQELNQSFVTYTLLPYLIQIEQEMSWKLLSRKDQWIGFNLNALLRGNLLQRYQAYAIARQWGWLSANDICILEDLNPLPGNQGNVYLHPLNMANAADEGKKAQPVSGSDPSAAQFPTGESTTTTAEPTTTTTSEPAGSTTEEPTTTPEGGINA